MVVFRVRVVVLTVSEVRYGTDEFSLQLVIGMNGLSPPSGDETSASNDSPREVAALRLCSDNTRLVMAASTVDGSSNGISMI